MQTHPERIVGAKDDRQERERLLQPFSSSPEQQVDDEQLAYKQTVAVPILKFLANGRPHSKWPLVEKVSELLNVSQSGCS
jgi:hypothetical protein